MVRDVSLGLRVTQDLSSLGTQHTEEAKTKEEVDLPELNGIIDNLDVGTPSDENKSMTQGTAADTPRQDGQVRNRGEGVKDFFKGVGKGIGDFFSKIGKAFTGAFEAIKQAVATRTGGAVEVPTPKMELKPLDKQGASLLDFCELLSKDCEAAYQDYRTDTTDDPPMSRMEFVQSAFPDLPGGTDSAEEKSGFVGDRMEHVKAHLKDVKDPGLNEMRHAVVERLNEMPSLKIMEGVLFEDELPALHSDPSTFLRENTAFSKLDKFISRQEVNFVAVASDTMNSVKTKIQEYSKLDIVQGVPMAMESFTKEQADAVGEVSNAILNDLLDTDHDKPNSFLNQIPQSYCEFLKDKADTIMAQTDVDLSVRQGAVKTLYVNSLFLRGISGDIFTKVATDYRGVPGQKFAIQTQQFMQSFINGLPSLGKGNDLANEVFKELLAKQGPRMDDFLIAVGMPNFGTGETEDLKSSDTSENIMQSPFETMTEDDLGITNGNEEKTGPSDMPPLPPTPDPDITENQTDGLTEPPSPGDLTPPSPGTLDPMDMKDTMTDGDDTPGLEEDDAKL